MTDPTNTPTIQTPLNPYLHRAVWEWLSDNGLTPQIAVDTAHPELVIPSHLKESPTLVLKVAKLAVARLEIKRAGWSFDAKFAGVPFSVFVPAGAVLAVYAEENGLGMGFTQPTMAMVTAEEKPAPASPSTASPPDEPQPPRSRPTLRVVK